MNFYPMHIGDYSAHTMHLEPMEDLAYRRLLDWVYLHEAPLPADPAQVARLIRMKAYTDDVEAVLREFFELGPDGWFNVRCNAEIARSKIKISQRNLDVTNAQWTELRALVFQRDNFTCVYCGKQSESPHCDHVFPLSKGGLSELGNLATACAPCNWSKGAKTLDEWMGA